MTAFSIYKELILEKLNRTSKLQNIHEGETCFILGNGPSLNDINLSLLDSFRTFGTNGIFLKYTPSYFTTISNMFYLNHIDSIKRLSGCVKFIGQHLTDLQTGGKNEFILNTTWCVYGRAFGLNFPAPFRFSKRPDQIVYVGGSVLFVCLQLAYFMGFSKVILLGVDHHFGFPRSEAIYGGRNLEVKESDKVHFDPKYTPSGSSMHCDMIATERSFEIALKAFHKYGREIYNATEGTCLNIVPKLSLAKII